MKNNIKIILAIAIFIFCGSWVVYIINQNNKPSGFKRIFLTTTITLKNMLKLPPSSFAFAWEPTDSIYLKDYKVPLHLMRTNYSLSETKDLYIKNPFLSKTNKAIEYSYFQNSIYLSNQKGEVMQISKEGVQNSGRANYSFDYPNAISSNSLIIRKFLISKKERRLELVKKTFGVENSAKGNFLIPKQIDGVFCSDGILKYNKFNKKIFYTFFYRGQFLCLDTNLKLLYKAKTIDTITKANLKVGIFKKVNDTSLRVQKTTTPPKLVNRDFCLDEKYIYILSALKAENETPDTFNRNHSIDVYSQKNGGYLFSLHVPKYNNFKLLQFQIKNNLLICIYRDYLVTYLLSNSKFN